MKPLCRHWRRPELASIDSLGWRPCLHWTLNMIFLGLGKAMAFMAVLSIWRKMKRAGRVVITRLPQRPGSTTDAVWWPICGGQNGGPLSNPWLHPTLVLTLARLIDNFNDNRHYQFVLKAVDVAMQAVDLLAVSTGIRDSRCKFRLATGIKPNPGLNPGLEPNFKRSSATGNATIHVTPVAIRYYSGREVEFKYRVSAPEHARSLTACRIPTALYRPTPPAD